MFTNLHVLDFPESEKYDFGIMSVCEHDNSKTVRPRGMKFGQEKSKNSNEEDLRNDHVVLSPKPERGLLNDGLLNLYKKELDFKKENSSDSQNASDKENKSKENGADTSKTPSKSGKRSKSAGNYLLIVAFLFLTRLTIFSYAHYVGESEKAVRKVFERAQNSAPCIIFFDALCPPRSGSKERMVVESVVTQLLTVSSRIRGRKQVYLIAATNRIDKIESAMLRPGRFGKILYVGLPTPSGRVEILKSLLKRKTLEEGFDIEKIALDPRCEHFSGADISSLVNEAGSKAVRELKEAGKKLLGDLVLSSRHFDKAFMKVKPSISSWERRCYEKQSAEYSRQ
ncbi:Nuclear valosin-containing protein-like [Araneus ventricosus]|uniref:Nuclear valosin-containing protein-like n=1 Tax=Araneus ventricosus TaxID=182803 RepID=A0A4Y2IPR5_ARAVE|nr:Nuclear valosin-containing protein-like [Araneus ventricosus]